MEEEIRRLKLYQRCLESIEESIKLDQEYLAKYKEYPVLSSPEFMAKQEDNAAWYKEQIAALEPIVKAGLAEIYKGVETIDRLLEIDEKGVFWLYSVEPGEKPTVDECLGRNDDKYTLAIIPKELHTLTHQEPPVRVKVVKEKPGPHKRRKVTTQVFIDADYFINPVKP